MPSRLSKIDDLTRLDHTFLTAADKCYYLGEYTARKGFTFSQTNDLINNLKKPMDRRDRPEWRYKESAIRKSGEMFREALNPETLAQATLVPIPPSKKKDHPEYDDRLLRILGQLGQGLELDIRELVIMRTSIEAAHLVETPRNVKELIDWMELDPALVDPKPKLICVFDDVLTTGAHFKAVESILRGAFPEVPLAGVFIARRAPEATPF